MYMWCVGIGEALWNVPSFLTYLDHWYLCGAVISRVMEWYHQGTIVTCKSVCCLLLAGWLMQNSLRHLSMYSFVHWHSNTPFIHMLLTLSIYLIVVLMLPRFHSSFHVLVIISSHPFHLFIYHPASRIPSLELPLCAGSWSKPLVEVAVQEAW